ncbi:Major facilitator sugar transporter-like [Trinorchestia longiramus]|nr:Major facilitator sugar transporter-like [Trinorchestia longiramus]
MGAVAAGSVLGYSSPASYQFRGNFRPENEVKSPMSEMPSFPLSLSSNKVSSSSSSEVLPETVDAGGIGGITGFNMSEFCNRTTLIPLGHDLHLTLYQLQWFSSLYAIGALLGGLITYPMLQYCGRKKTIVAAAAPAILGWILIGK